MTVKYATDVWFHQLQAAIKATSNLFTKNKYQEDEFRNLPTKQEPGLWTDFFKEYLITRVWHTEQRSEASTEHRDVCTPFQGQHLAIILIAGTVNTALHT